MRATVDWFRALYASKFGPEVYILANLGLGSRVNSVYSAQLDNTRTGEPMVAMFPIVRMGSRENHSAVMVRQEAGVWRKNRDLMWKKDDSIWSTPPTVSEGGITFQTETGSGLQKWMGRKRKTTPSGLTLHILHKTIYN